MPFADPDNCTKEIFDVHCFNCAAVSDAAFELGSRISLSVTEAEKINPAKGATPEQIEKLLAATPEVVVKFGFLPAPATWLEDKENGVRWAYLIKTPAKRRLGYYIASHKDEEANAAACDVFCFSDSEAIFSGKWLQHTMMIVPTTCSADDVSRLNKAICFITGCLLMINSPKIIGRTTYYPNRALEKKLTQKLGVGKFPLHAWTEIQLKVNKPVEIDDGEPHEAHLTGRRALHFVRKHIRIRLGQLEYVTSHWRGDPAIGIKRSRYKVTP